jgi:pilus assembly protein CpaE
VGGDPRLAEEARQCVSQSQPPVAVQWLKDGAVALARLGGGDIDALVVDPSSMGAGSGEAPDLLEKLRAAGKRTETIVVSESRDWTSDLRRIVAANLSRPSEARSGSRRGRKPKLIGFLGAKGGVGTTTVALNAAFVLAERHVVVLAELGAGNDTLKLRVRTTARSPWPPGGALACLWSVKETPGLRIALAQDMAVPEKVAAELETMGEEAGYVLLDLGSAVTELVKRAMPKLDALVLVVDMELLSVACAKRVLSAVQQPEICPLGTIGIVVVNRASLACPLSVDEVQRLIGMPVLGTVPPAGDLCSSALKALRPVVHFDSESLAARSLIQVACSCAEMV